MALSTRETPRPTLGATRARQGRLGKHVVWVLVFGTLLAGLALFAAWGWRADDLASTSQDGRFQDRGDAAMFQSPDPNTMDKQQPAAP